MEGCVMFDEAFVVGNWLVMFEAVIDVLGSGMRLTNVSIVITVVFTHPVVVLSRGDCNYGRKCKSSHLTYVKLQKQILLFLQIEISFYRF